MPIVLKDFGGTIPKLNPEALPENVGQLAHNCDLTGGVLSPLNLDGPFVSAHEDDGTLTSKIQPQDIFTITKPAAPSQSSVAYIAQPSEWLRVAAIDWSTLDDGEVHSTDQGRFAILNLINTTYTETGMELTYYLPPTLYIFPAGGPYFFKGPRYQFEFTADPGGTNGGPDASVTYPSEVSSYDREFPLQRVPLIDTTGNVYANFQVIDVMGPKYDQDLLVTASGGISFYAPGVGGASVTFTVDMNYAQPRRKQLFYTQSLVQHDDAEGPPSEVSSQITLKPGQVLTLSTPRGGATNKNKLYRSPTGGTDFLLLDDVDADTYVDTKSNLQPIVIPPFGNHPGDVDKFKEGSIIHPANFAAAFHEKTLYLSDYFRFWAWPDEFTVPFNDPIDAIALSGSTIVVFSGTKVYGVSGNNPEVMSVFLISDETPLLNPLSLCSIGPSVFFASNDGMISITQNNYEIITSDHFTRKQWKRFFPENMIATTADNSIFLATSEDARIPSDPEGVVTRTLATTASPTTLDPVQQTTNLRIDLEESLKRVTSYDTTSSTDMKWTSKRFWSDQKVIYDYAQISADAPVTLDVYADRILVLTKTIDSDQPVSLIDAAVPHAHEWEFSISGEGDVRSAIFFDRKTTTIGDSVSLTPENTDTFKNIRLKFPDRDTFVGGWASFQGAGSVPLNFYGDSNDVVVSDIRNGKFFTLPRTMERATQWRIEAAGANRIDEIFLTRRVTQSVDGGIQELGKGAFPPWLAKKYEISGGGRLKSVKVHSDAGVLMNLYFDGSTAVSTTVALTPGKEARIPDAAPYGSVEFDFNGQDHHVNEVIVTLDQPQDIGTEGINLTNSPTWRGKTFKFADCGVFACGSIGASSYTDLTLHLYADGALVHSEVVTNGKVFDLPRTLSEAALWEIDIETEANVTSLILLPRTPVPTEGENVHIINPKTTPPWMYSRYEFVDQMQPMSVRVEATQNVTMRLWADGATEPKRLELTAGTEHRIDDIFRAGSWDFDFDGDDCEVTEVGLFGLNIQPVSGPVQETTRPNWRRQHYRFPNKGKFAAGSIGVPPNKNVELQIFVDGIVSHTETVTGGGVFVFPRHIAEGTVIEVDIREVAIP